MTASVALTLTWDLLLIEFDLLLIFNSFNTPYKLKLYSLKLMSLRKTWKGASSDSGQILGFGTFKYLYSILWFLKFFILFHWFPWICLLPSQLCVNHLVCKKKEKCILLRLPMLKIYFCGIQIFCIILPNGILQVRQFIF